VVTCSAAQVAVENGVAAGGLLIAVSCCAFIVKVVVGTTAVSTFWNLATGHAHIGEVAKFKAVVAY